ncbi:MAG: hypothetical protein ACJ0GR_02475 [Prochlorococcaceae cyanobacterium]
MTIHLLGAATPSGAFFEQLAASCHAAVEVISYSRSDPSKSVLDLKEPDSFDLTCFHRGDVLVSFAPIWLLAPFISHLHANNPGWFKTLGGIVACSSSSAFTKRFAFNRFDRALVFRLRQSEAELAFHAEQCQLPLLTLRPALIYGSCGGFGDRNLSRLVALMRRLPVLPLPEPIGSRQPIHASQLAGVALRSALAFSDTPKRYSTQQLQLLGGDEVLSYRTMLLRLQAALPEGDAARRCRLIAVPQRLFFAAAWPLQCLSPKTFEAVLRMAADLSGFPPAHELLNSEAQLFPLQPLALP